MKKGFTLIELLAVIIVLGIIALIAIPAVTNVIEDASKGAAEVSAKHYMDALNDKISLLELDEDGENDIANGIKNVGDIDVNIKGDMPTSGTYKIQNGKVVEANLVVNGYNVKCTNKCVATKGVTTYVYYASIGNGLTSLDDSNKLTEPPSDKRVYLKYPVLNGKLQTPKACVYNDVEELCLNPNEEEISTEKILDYYGLTKSVFETRKDNGIVKTYNQDKTKLCQVFYQDGQYKSIVCTDKNLSISSSAMNHTMVLVLDDNVHGQWGIKGNGDSYFLEA